MQPGLLGHTALWQLAVLGQFAFVHSFLVTVFLVLFLPPSAYTAAPDIITVAMMLKHIFFMWVIFYCRPQAAFHFKNLIFYP